MPRDLIVLVVFHEAKQQATAKASYSYFSQFAHRSMKFSSSLLSFFLPLHCKSFLLKPSSLSFRHPRTITNSMSPPMGIIQQQPQEHLQESASPTTATKLKSSKINSWQLHPSNQFKKLQETHGKGNVKLVHIIRHAEGTHNVENAYRDIRNMDARLTPKGNDQCAQVAAAQWCQLDEGDDIDICVWTSSMTRCIQTALQCFPHLAQNEAIPFIAYDNFRETVNYQCDRRRPIQEISREFPRVDFSYCPDDDAIWDSYRQRLSDQWEKHMESAELHTVAQRALEGFQMLEKIPQSQIIISTHSAFLRCVLSWGHPGGVPMVMPQDLDLREDKTNHKLFEYNCDGSGFEEYMRADYDNCELRSFCFLVPRRKEEEE